MLDTTTEARQNWHVKLFERETSVDHFEKHLLENLTKAEAMTEAAHIADSVPCGDFTLSPA